MERGSQRPPEQGGASHKIGSEEQLFLDNGILDRLMGCSRVIQRPEKYREPILQPDGLPWEKAGFCPGITGVLQDPDDGLYKMWYWQVMSSDAFGAGQGLCYAQSTDGLHWEKPLLDSALPFEGCQKTNLVMRDICMSGLVYNPNQSQLPYRFLMIYSPQREAAARGKAVISRLAGSQDGICWTVLEPELTHRHHHEARILWDESLDRWVSYGQYSHHWHHGSRTRQIGRQTSQDFLHWSPKEVVLSADWDPNLEPNREFHEMSVRKVGGLYIGITGEAHADPLWCKNEEGANWRDHFHVNLGLYTSRDGIRFQRVGGPEPWVDNGEPGSPDYGFVSYTPSGMIDSGGKTILYDTAIPSKQNWFRHPQKPYQCQPREFKREQDAWEMRAAAAGHSIQYGREGRTTRALLLREHRFAAITPLAGEGAVLTKQLTFLGSSLKVNAQCDYGLILVELLDVKFHPYPGFAAGDCQPVHGGKGQIWHQVVWNNGASVKSLHGKPVRIRFVLKEASIFGFQFF